MLAVMGRMHEAVAFAVMTTLLSPVSNGQQKTFEIHGTVVAGDQGLANVGVSLRPKSTGGLRKTITDGRGAFSFDGLPPGHYVLQVGRESVTVPLSSFLEVDLNVDHGLTLLLPLYLLYSCPDGITPSHYFRQLDAGSDKDLAALTGTVKGKHGTPIEGADVTLYIPKLGRIARTRTTREGSFSFAGLTVDENYWIQVLTPGYFVGEFTKLKVLPGYESVYDDLTLEPCEPGHCEPSLREIRILPGCA
jgi:Carboxypeptidase regulatory-like domain